MRSKTSWPDQGSHEDGLVQRRDMRFPLVATSYHFHLKEGGEMVVTANDPGGKSSRGDQDAPYAIARMFSDGNLNAPMMIRETHSLFQIVDRQTGVAPTVGS